MCSKRAVWFYQPLGFIYRHKQQDEKDAGPESVTCDRLLFGVDWGGSAIGVLLIGFVGNRFNGIPMFLISTVTVSRRYQALVGDTHGHVM